MWKHSTLRDIDGIVDASAMRDYFVFTIVRNPWDRMVTYYHWAREQSFDHPVVRAACNHDFAGFLHEPDVWRPLSAAPYIRYVQGPSGVDHCNLYMRLEHSETDVAPLEEHLGFRIDVGHVNASSCDQDYRAYYTNELRDHVAHVCADDTARFEYAF